MKLIRILHVLGGLNRGGAETMVMNFYRAIDRTKVQFDFVIHTDEPQNYSDEIKKMGGKIYIFPRYNGLNTFELRKKWNDFLKEHPGYKVLHSHVRSYASIYLPIAKKHGVKTIIHAHSTSNGSGIKSFAKKILQMPLRYQADYLFSCSQISGEWLFGKKSLKKSNYLLIPNAIDIEKYALNENIRNEYRKKLNIETEKVFIHIGRLHEAKNHIFLINVFKKLSEIEPNVRLLIVGDGELRDIIENEITKHSLSGKIGMLGMREDIPELLNVADCFLFPSKWEGLPVTVVEAQAAQLPCFVSDTITDEVGISDLVTYLPIDKGEKIWVDTILNGNIQKHDVTVEIKNANFDVRNVSNWLVDFYNSIIK